ncbi:MAG: hypothetical protein OEZ39_04100 [Gammaproteobacteria bacterium]|nr:hypothetical protein [Gammaproteobacteria bacterium]MDH5651040.1 hypothetical protein [Gammaproteobacteria bacterium]
MQKLLLTIGAAALTCFIFHLLPYGKALDAIGMVLAVIASIYIGFAIADGRKNIILIECFAAAVFLGLALFGMWGKPVWLVIGYFAHGGWDLIHHPAAVQTKVRRWYPPLCVLYDWIIGAWLLVWLGWI